MSNISIARDLTQEEAVKKTGGGGKQENFHSNGIEAG